MAVAETAYLVPELSATTLQNTKSLLKILILGSIAGELSFMHAWQVVRIAASWQEQAH